MAGFARAWASPMRPVLCGLLACVPLAGQALFAEERHSQTVDIAVGAGSSVQTGAISWNYSYGIGDSRRAQIGFGTRLSSFFGGDPVAYTTADATLIRQNRVNVLAVPSPRTYALSLDFAVKYRLLRHFEAGFDIDVVGFGFGKSVSGSYRGTASTFPEAQRAHPSSFSLLRGGKPDRGQLDSEFFLSYRWSDRWAVRAGFSHFLSEYTTTGRLDFENDRFRHSANLGFVGLTFRL